jgi:hypothetical protein
MTVEARPDTSSAWLRLLRRATEGSSPRGVYKNADAGLAGAGDVDFLAPEGDWDALELDFLSWARAEGLGSVIACRHMPGALFLIALRRGEAWLQLDVRARITWRGATLLEPERAAQLMETDGRGFRRLRPGAEGVVKLVVSGVAPGGRPKPRGLAKERVRELLASDPEGARAAAGAFGVAAPAVRRGAAAAASGGWDGRAMAAVEVWALARAPAAPATLMGQARARRAKRDCLVLRTGIASGRMVPDDPAEWLRSVEETHCVHDHRALSEDHE